MLNVDILLIDDDEEEFEILLQAVKDFPTLTRCVHAKNAESALLMLNKLKAKFILVDMRMPIVTGLDCIEMLIKDGHNKQAQVVMYSHYMNDELCEQTIKAGGNGCLKKPFTIPELAETISDMVKNGKV